MTTKNNIKNNSLFVTILLVVVVFMMSFVIYQMANANVEKQQFSETATEMAQNDPVNRMIRGLEEQLATPNLSEESRQELMVRLNAFYAEATLYAGMRDAATNNPTVYTQVPKVTWTPGPTRVSEKMIGIFPNPAVPLPSSSYQINNAWANYVDGKYYIVYAGSDKDKPSRAIVAVMSSEPYSIQIFQTPQDATSVTLIDEQGYLLTLQSADGKLFYFDVLSMSFVGDLSRSGVGDSDSGTLATPPAVLVTEIPYPGP